MPDEGEEVCCKRWAARRTYHRHSDTSSCVSNHNKQTPERICYTQNIEAHRIENDNCHLLTAVEPKDKPGGSDLLMIGGWVLRFAPYSPGPPPSVSSASSRPCRSRGNIYQPRWSAECAPGPDIPDSLSVMSLTHPLWVIRSESSPPLIGRRVTTKLSDWPTLTDIHTANISVSLGQTFTSHSISWKITSFAPSRHFCVKRGLLEVVSTQPAQA